MNQNILLNSNSSASIAFKNFTLALENVAEAFDNSTEEFKTVVEKFKALSLRKNEEQDRILYLKMINNYSGYKFTFQDFRNV